jgi:hypothetical protein
LEERVFEKKLEVPEKEPVDYVISTVKATVAAIPKWWAAPASEVVSLILGSPVERRRDEFLEDLAWVVRETAAKVDNLEPEKLIQNEAFVSAMLQAARIAMGTHQKEKREYLRNALLNIATGKSTDELKQQIFLNAVEAFTPAHVKALDLIWRGAGRKIPWDQHPAIGLQNRDYGTALGIIVPEVKGQPSLLTAIFFDLRTRGFSTLGGPEQVFPQGGVITNLGIEFLNFILSSEDLGN